MVDLSEPVPLKECRECAYRACWKRPCQAYIIGGQVGPAQLATAGPLPDQPPVKVIEMADVSGDQ